MTEISSFSATVLSSLHTPLSPRCRCHQRKEGGKERKRKKEIGKRKKEKGKRKKEKEEWSLILCTKVSHPLKTCSATTGSATTCSTQKGGKKIAPLRGNAIASCPRQRPGWRPAVPWRGGTSPDLSPNPHNSNPTATPCPHLPLQPPCATATALTHKPSRLQAA